MRTPHILSVEATDTPSATATDDAGNMLILGDDGHVANGFLDIDLEALGNNSTNGLLTRTGAGTVAARTLIEPAAGIDITNADGVSGNPTFALANDTAALEALASTGFAVRTGSDAWTQRTIEGTAGSVTVTNNDGVSGNPVISLDATLAALAAANWVANAIPIGTGADTLSQVTFAANTFPARASTGDLVAKSITNGSLALLAAFNNFITYSSTTLSIVGGRFDGTYFGPDSGAVELATTFGGNARAVRIDSSGDLKYVIGGASYNIWHANNDGAGSGLDADLLDAQSGAYYLARANHTGTQTLATISDAGTAAAATIGTSGDTVPKNNTANTYSAAQTVAVSGMSSSVKTGQVSDATTYGVVSLNGSVTAAGTVGLIGGAAGDANLYLRAATGGQFDFRVNAVLIGALSTTGWSVPGSILSTHATAGIGYATGAGGTVTQLTSKSTSVTLNKASGQITMNNAALGAGAAVSFQVDNSVVASTDTIDLNLASGHAGNNTYRYWVDRVAAGLFVITVENKTAGSLNEELVFNFGVNKRVTS